MSARFADIQPGDQVEMRAKSRPSWLGLDDGGRDPERPVRAAVVTHRWTDPVERKEYVGLAILKRGGEVGEPTIKHTVRGLAQAGWYPARRDWLEYARALDAGEVVALRPRR